MVNELVRARGEELEVVGRGPALEAAVLEAAALEAMGAVEDAVEAVASGPAWEVADEEPTEGMAEAMEDTVAPAMALRPSEVVGLP